MAQSHKVGAAWTREVGSLECPVRQRSAAAHRGSRSSQLGALARLTDPAPGLARPVLSRRGSRRPPPCPSGRRPPCACSRRPRCRCTPSGAARSGDAGRRRSGSGRRSRTSPQYAPRVHSSADQSSSITSIAATRPVAERAPRGRRARPPGALAVRPSARPARSAPRRGTCTSTPGSPPRRRVVVRLADELVRRERLAGEPVLAPERVVVHREHLDHAALRDPLLGAQAPRRAAPGRSGSRREVRRDRARRPRAWPLALRRDRHARPPSSGSRAPASRRRRGGRAPRPCGSGSAASRRRRASARQRSGSNRFSTPPAPAIVQSPPAGRTCATASSCSRRRGTRAGDPRARSSSTSRCSQPRTWSRRARRPAGGPRAPPGRARPRARRACAAAPAYERSAAAPSGASWPA